MWIMSPFELPWLALPILCSRGNKMGSLPPGPASLFTGTRTETAACVCGCSFQVLQKAAKEHHELQTGVSVSKDLGCPLALKVSSGVGSQRTTAHCSSAFLRMQHP